MASLAFIAGDHAYLEQGAFCTLPVRPFWYRLALSWVPRYIILLFILSVYFIVYAYVRLKFKDFDAHLSGASGSLDATYVDGNLEELDGSIRTGSHPSLRERHSAIKRQLRYMFVYPVIYLVLWVVPFISHCYGYKQAQTPYPLSTAAIVSYTLQCGADCIVFLMREKPWRRVEPIWGPSRQLSFFHSKRPEKAALSMKQHSESRNQSFQARGIRHWWDVESFSSQDDQDVADKQSSSSGERRASLNSQQGGEI